MQVESCGSRAPFSTRRSSTARHIPRNRSGRPTCDNGTSVGHRAWIGRVSDRHPQQGTGTSADEGTARAAAKCLTEQCAGSTTQDRTRGRALLLWVCTTGERGADNQYSNCRDSRDVHRRIRSCCFTFASRMLPVNDAYSLTEQKAFAYPVPHTNHNQSYLPSNRPDLWLEPARMPCRQ